METEYLTADSYSILIYIAIAVIGWIWKIYKKNSEKVEGEQGGNFFDDEQPTHRPTYSTGKNFDDILESFSQNLKKELRTPEVQPAMVDTSNMVNSLEEFTQKYGAKAIVKKKEAPKKRFDEYKLKEEGKNTFADLLDDTENFQKAFVLSQILERKEY